MRKPFSLVYDPSKDPAFSTRSLSLQRFTGGGAIAPTCDPRVTISGDKRDLVSKFKTGTVDQTLPSRKLWGRK